MPIKTVISSTVPARKLPPRSVPDSRRRNPISHSATRFLLLTICLLPTQVAALSLTYIYRGNNFDKFEGMPGVFATTDRVDAIFTIDCSAAHSEGDCRNLPYDDYLQPGAIDAGSLHFTAGPATLPAPDGSITVNRFFFSTDADARITGWDMDLYLDDPSLNIDTDNIDGGVDSAAAMGGFANVDNRPGVWGVELAPDQNDVDIVVTKSVDTPVIQDALQPIEFTVRVENRGPGSAKDVVVLDKLPEQLVIPEGLAPHTTVGYYDPGSGRWDVGDLEDSLPQSLTVPVQVAADPVPPCIVNSASVELNDDSDPANNTSSVAVRQPGITGCTDLLIEALYLYQLTSDCDADFPVSVQIRVHNAGPEAVSNVVLSVEETLFKAPGLVIHNAECEELRCVWSNFDAGQTRIVTGMSDSFNLAEPQRWEIRAGVTIQQADLDAENNILTQRTQVEPHQRSASCDQRPGGPDWDLGGVGGGGGCFIATAVYGSDSHPYVQILREFRDDVLADSRWGRTFIESYYRNSPELACFIEEHGSMRLVFRGFLTPVVLVIAHPWPAALMAVATLLLILYTWRRVRAGGTTVRSHRSRNSR